MKRRRRRRRTRRDIKKKNRTCRRMTRASTLLDRLQRRSKLKTSVRSTWLGCRRLVHGMHNGGLMLSSWR